MSWEIEYIPQAAEDFDKLDGSQKKLVLKALNKVAKNPLPDYEGGYGKPLGNVGRTMLAGVLKIKLKASGIRIVYKLQRTDTKMQIIIIGMRADNAVYDEASKRIKSL
ncbi:MAG: type II toxin-antitoxin system RelE/ParE family toxin [Bacillota bacterium]|nr:type II toxin-antitoxin system RelE/ParE family toxin [Bacillota bacterium]